MQNDRGFIGGYESLLAIVRDLIDKISAIYESSAKEKVKKRKGLDKELEETMRALGYIR